MQPASLLLLEITELADQIDPLLALERAWSRVRALVNCGQGTSAGDP